MDVPFFSALVFVDPASLTVKAPPGWDGTDLHVISDRGLLPLLTRRREPRDEQLTTVMDAALRAETWRLSPQPSRPGMHLTQEFQALRDAVGPAHPPPRGPFRVRRSLRKRCQRARAGLQRKDEELIGIGYQELHLSDLIERLRTEGVNVLVDIRLNAISRKAGYSKRALAAALAAAGIRYLHDPRLGNPKDNRAGYADTASADGIAARERFVGLLDGGAGAEGIRDLASLVEQESVAVLCYESDENHCHRQQVMAAVRAAQGSLHSAQVEA